MIYSLKVSGKQLGFMLLLFAFASGTEVWGLKINVSIDSDPNGQVFINGQNQGTTPMRVWEFTFRRADKHAFWSVFQLSFTRNDYQAEERSLRFDDESRASVERSLLRKGKKYLLEARTETGEPLNAEVIINATSVGTTPVTLPLAFSRSDKAEAWPEFQVDFQIPTSYQTESIALRRNSMPDHMMVLAPVTDVPVTFAAPVVVATPRGAVYEVVENEFLGKIDTRDTSMHIRNLKRVTAYRWSDRNLGSAFACINSFTLSPAGRLVIYAVTERDFRGRYYSKLYRKQAGDDAGGITSFTKDSGYLDTNPITCLGSDILLLQSNRSLRRKLDIFQVGVDRKGGFARITGDPRYNFHPVYTDCNRFFVYVSMKAEHPFPQPQLSTIRGDGALATQLQVSGVDVNHNQDPRILIVREDGNTDTLQAYSMTTGGKLATARCRETRFSKSEAPGRPVMDATVFNSSKKNCFLLIVDIVGVTAMSQTVSTDKLGKDVKKWIFSCRSIIEKHHGVINRYLGDTVFAFCRSENIEVEEVRNAIYELVEEQGRSYFDFRTVVHFGEIQVGGTSLSGEDNLLGEHVNFLFRMEKVVSSLKKLTLFSEEAVEMLGIGDRTASLGDHAVHSFTGPYSFFEIILG